MISLAPEMSWSRKLLLLTTQAALIQLALPSQHTSTFVQNNLWRVVLDLDCKNTLGTDISNITGPYVWQTTEVT